MSTQSRRYSGGRSTASSLWYGCKRKEQQGSESTHSHRSGIKIKEVEREDGGGRRRAGREKEENPRRNSEREGRRAMMAGGVAS